MEWLRKADRAFAVFYLTFNIGAFVMLVVILIQKGFSKEWLGAFILNLSSVLLNVRNLFVNDYK